MRNKIFNCQLNLLVFLILLISGCKQENTVTDIDGNVYRTINIGTQVWLVENLKVTHYRNGEPIPNITDNNTWRNLNTGAYSDYDNTPSNSDIYGKLYNWYAVNNSNCLCPKGWHVPTDNEWTKLTDYLGGEDLSGGMLKESGTTHWSNSNVGATNKTGFTALPGGNRDLEGKFDFIKDGGFWWSSTEHDDYGTWLRYIHYSNSEMLSYLHSKTHGFSVRCIKDK